MSEVDDTPDEIRWLYANGGNHPSDVARWLKENTPEQLAAEYKRHREEWEAAVEAEVTERNAKISIDNAEELKKPAKDRQVKALEPIPTKLYDKIETTTVAATFVALDEAIGRK